MMLRAERSSSLHLEDDLNLEVRHLHIEQAKELLALDSVCELLFNANVNALTLFYSLCYATD